jgi:hypothetical protein
MRSLGLPIKHTLWPAALLLLVPSIVDSLATSLRVQSPLGHQAPLLIVTGTTILLALVLLLALGRRASRR